MFRLFRSRLLWLTIGVLTLAGVAFLMVVAATAVLMTMAGGGADPDPDGLDRLAVPLGLLAAVTAVAASISVSIMVRRSRARQWLPLREQMMHAAATQPANHLVQVLSLPNPAAGGQVLAIDLISRYQGPLWIPGWQLPRGAVVCVTMTPGGGRVRAWMTGQFWRATSREAARIERRTTRALARAEREQDEAEEREISAAAAQAVTEAERILRQHSNG